MPDNYEQVKFNQKIIKMDNYIFNEALKRLEPTYKKCSFCEVQDSTKASNDFYTDIYRVEDRTNIIVYRSVEYSKFQIGLPRCSNCMKIHSGSLIKSCVYTLIFVIIICSICYFSYNYLTTQPETFNNIMWQLACMMFGTAFPLITGIILQMQIEKRIIRNNNIFNKKQGAEKNIVVQQFIENGWSLYKPSPRG